MLSVVGGPRPAHRLAGGLHRHQRDQFGDRLVDQGFSLLVLLPVENCSSRAESFPWISITFRAVSNSAVNRWFSLRSRAASFSTGLAGAAP